MIYLISGFFSFLIAIIITPLFIEYLTKLGILDNPDNNRKLHSSPVPRMGGLVIYLIIISFILIFYSDIREIKELLIGSFILIVLGVIDDFIGVRWYIKFIVQSIASIFLVFQLFINQSYSFNIAGYNLPTEFAIILSFFAIVGLLNAFNLLDGLDGLVSGLSLIIASLSFLLSIYVNSYLQSLLSIVLIGSTLGFLKYNGNPARIFLGDTGSLILGYFNIWVLFSAASEISSSQSIDLVFIFIVFSLPIIDTLRVIFVRILNKRSPFLPDNNHIHHIIYSKKVRHKTTVLIVLMLVSATIFIGLFYQFYSKEIGLIIFTIFAPVLIFIGDIIEYIIKKENLIYYGRLIKKTPEFFIIFYNVYLLNFIAFALFSLFIALIFQKIQQNDLRYLYLLFFSVATLTYFLGYVKRQYNFSNILIFLNFLLFFYITGFNGFFYHLYKIPFIGQMNINQIIIIILLPMVGFFVLFKDRILKNHKEQIFSGTDLILGTLILSIFLFIHISDLKSEFYYYSDILLRSYLVYIYYKIIAYRYRSFHFQLYLATYILVIIALMKILIF